MSIREKIALRQAVALGSICGLFTAAALVAAFQYLGLARWILLFAAYVWASLGISAFLGLMSPFGWFGVLGRWVAQLMSEDESA